MINDNDVQIIVETHCTGCHAAQPTTPGFSGPPKGVILETLTDVEKYKQQVYAQSVGSHAMPPGNMTQMTLEERKILGAWIENN